MNDPFDDIEYAVRRARKSREEGRAYRGELLASARQAWKHAKDSDRAAENLQAELERLRAVVTSLPDVGPAKRSGRFIEVDGHGYSDHPAVADFLLRAARLLAVAAFLEAEAAADTTNPDDEVEELGRVLCGARLPWNDWDKLVPAVKSEFLEMARAVIAHRARNDQEAGQ